MALFEVTAYDKKIYEEELKDFLPDKIFDIHTHVHRKDRSAAEAARLAALNPKKEEAKKEEKPKEKRTVSWPSLVAAHNPIEDLMETYELMFPGKECKSLMFGGGQVANEYVSEVSRIHGWPALLYSHPTMTADEMEKAIRDGGFLGIKCYLSLSPAYIPAKEIRIFDFFPKHQLKRLDEMGAICMCHIPRNGRLKDPVNVAQIAEIKEEFPNLRLIVAHVGRAYVDSDVGDAFETLGKYPTLKWDFCANCCDFAIREVIKAAGPKNVMFGTDMPILRMRTHRIQENGTYINLVPPGMYGDVSVDPHLREVTAEEAEKITFFAYEELLAFKRVAIELGLSKQDIEDIMYNNAVELIEGARKSIYGE